MDLFGAVPFATEKDALGSFVPKQSSRTDMFNYVETELKAIENELPAAKANEYGRADKAAAQEAIKFFDWSFTNGKKLASDLDYVPLPDTLTTAIRAKVWTQIQK